MKNTPKTIKASGSLKHPGSINEAEQTYRDQFKVMPVGGLLVSSERGADSAQIDDVQADDVLEVLLENNVTLFTRRDDYERDFQSDASRNVNDNELAIESLSLGPPSRGLGSWAIKLLDVFRVDVSSKAGLSLCKKFEKSSVARPDLFKISQAAPLKLTPADFVATSGIDKPILVFIHGTASSTAGSFGGLWEDSNADLLNQLSQYYTDRMFALEHWSLSQNPIRNALDLVAALPNNAHVHLLSHSRGGMVGELICRNMAGNNKQPFEQADLDHYNTRATAIVASIKTGKTATRNAYQEQISELKQLNDLLIQKDIHVDKFVRVACPARGTTLASERLDRLLSVFFNVVGLIPAVRATPYYSLLKNFIRALVKTRTKAHLLPGLEAQMPGSPLVALLNENTNLLSSKLLVVSGDTEREGILGQIAMLLPDRFYDSDHDLVVNTPSMYGGAERKGGGRYYFHQGDDVSHFNYFRNRPTATRVIKGLLLNDAELGPYFCRELPVVSAPIASRSANENSGPQPVVFLLPGIMGSELVAGKTTIWAKKLKLAFGGLSKLEISDQQVLSSGLIGDSYQKLFEYLDRDNEVIPFHYDWRTTLEDAASKLAREIKAACRQAARHDQPVSIIAHSMGGLLVRLMMVKHADAWNAMLRHPDSRFIMLGTPNGGSFSIPRMLFGHDKLIKGVALLDLFHSHAQLLDIIREYPGVLLLLPFGHQRFDFFKDETWLELANTDSNIFAPPLKAQLVKAAKIRSLINSSPLALEDEGRILYIAGHAKTTPADLTVVDNKPVFRGTAQGDGRVPWATGIPTGIPTWYMEAQHGDLANHEPAFDAIVELLRTGQTELLPDRQPISTRGLELFDIQPDEVDVYPTDRDLHAWALGSSGITAHQPDIDARKIKLNITHGNIAFSNHPVMVGHYENDGIFSAEKYLDHCLEGRLSHCFKLGIYPDKLNSAELILNAGSRKPAGALIVGLGAVGGLTISSLTDTIRNAMHRYAFDMQSASGSSEIAVTSLLVGASASGLPIQDSLMAILQGVKQANQSLSLVYPRAQISINELQIIELWEDRAILTSRAANYLFSVSDELRNAFSYEQRLELTDGGQYRAYHEEEAGWWNRLLIEETGDGGMSFHSVTDKARTEKRLLTTDRAKVDQYLLEATASTWSKRSLSRTLFETLMPYELKESSEKLDDTVLIVDESTARYPWELLEDRLSYSAKPLAVQNRLIRQLASLTFRRDPKMSSGNRALVIGEPHLGNADLWSALPGAAEEARMTAVTLENEGGFKVTSKINTNAANIFEALHEQSYRVLHFAGHGVHDFNLKQALERTGQIANSRLAKENASGMVIGDANILEPNDIAQIRRVPELVFINCCHLGDTNPAQTSLPGLAANLAVAFIRMGARAVVAAGWAVDDVAAKTFADVFYTGMIKGKCFGDAVYHARRTVFDRFPQLNTWGAYQCYGDPLYAFDNRNTTSTYTQQPAQTPGDLIDQLDTIAKQASTSTDSYRAILLGRVNVLLDEKSNNALVNWSARGNLCTAIARTFREFDLFEKTIEWYERATACEDATITLRAYEQYAEALVFHATAVVIEQPTKRTILAARNNLNRAVEILDNLDKVTASVHSDLKESRVKRACLRGIAYKRMTMVYRYSGADPVLVTDALKTMQDHYKDAYKLIENVEKYQRYNPYTNHLIATIMLSAVQERNYALNPAHKRSLEKLKRNCFDKDRAEPGFETMISGIECELVLKIADQTLPKHVSRLAKKYLVAKNRTNSLRAFRPVIENIDFLIELTMPNDAATTSRSKREYRQALLQTNQSLHTLRQKINPQSQ